MSTLQIDVVTDAQAAAADLDALSSAARGAGDSVATAGGQASAAGANFDGLADGSDNVASKSSQAAGALGDLGGGLEAIGLTGAGTALEGVGMGAQFAAGAGDAMNLVADTTVGKFILQTGAAIAHRGALIAGAAASGIMAGAQAALNAVMSLNPVMLLVIAIGLLIAGLILAYNKSETFRNIVNGVFETAKGFVMDFVGAVEDVIGIFADLPASARKAWDAVSGFAVDAFEMIKGKIDDFIGGLSSIASSIAGHFSDAFAPIQTAINWVQDLIDKIGSIDMPDINPFNRVLPGGGGTTGGTGKETVLLGEEPTVGTTVQVTVNGAIDPDSTARQVVELLRRYGGRSFAFDGLPT